MNEVLKGKLASSLDTETSTATVTPSVSRETERSLAVVQPEPSYELVTSHQVVLDRGQLELLKRTLAGDANLTDDELLLYGQVCERRGVDPYSNEIHVSKRSGRLIFQTGIDAFRRKAEETGLYAGQDPPQWCGPDGQWRDVWAETDPPVACRVTVYRKDWGARGLTVIAHWAEYVQKKSDGSTNAMWNQRGPAQLAKCGEALALRKAFPAKLEGLYTHDEMGQADNPIDITLSPQAIVGPAPTKREILVSEFKTAINTDDAAKALLKQWWKDAGIPTGNNWRETIEECPDEFIDAALDAIEAIKNGERPEPPDNGGGQKPTPDGDGGGERESGPQPAAAVVVEPDTAPTAAPDTAKAAGPITVAGARTAPRTDPKPQIEGGEKAPVSPALLMHPDLQLRPRDLVTAVSRDLGVNPPERRSIILGLFGKAIRLDDLTDSQLMTLADAIAARGQRESTESPDAVEVLKAGFGDGVEVVES